MGEFEDLRKAKQAKITYDAIIQQVFSFLLLAFALSRLVHHLGIVVNMSFSVLFSNSSLYISSQMSFPGGASGKEPACKCRRHKRCSVPGLGRSLWGGGMVTYSSIFTWRIPWTEEPGRLQPIGSQRVRHDWSDWARMSKTTNTLLTRLPNYHF